jgi:DNA-directed RNA polymerase subunit RPC12/RpoP
MVTIVKEKSRDNYHGYLNIAWFCMACKHVMNLPQQQNFNYCFHCGSKVIKKIGGEIEI